MKFLTLVIRSDTASRHLPGSIAPPKEVSDWIIGHATGHIGDNYGTNPLSRMALEIKKLPSIAKAAGLLTDE